MTITPDDNLTRLLLQKKMLSTETLAAFQKQALHNKQTLFQYKRKEPDSTAKN